MKPACYSEMSFWQWVKYEFARFTLDPFDYMNKVDLEMRNERRRRRLAHRKRIRVSGVDLPIEIIRFP